MDRRFFAEHGFTYIEIVILVAILSIVAALLFPYIKTLQEKGREAATKANISAIKSAISIYYGDHEGVWPATLDVDNKTPGYGFGDYLPTMPKVKVTYPPDRKLNPSGNEVTYKSFQADPSLEKPNIFGKGWRYEKETGRIWVNSTLLDSEGMPYSSYGYQ